MRRKKRGFTLLELLAVMAIIAILSGLGTKGYNLARRQTKETRAKAELEIIRAALEEYRVEFGRYPKSNKAENLPNLAFITHAVEGVELRDPWGNPYQYSCTNRFFYRIWSEGQRAGEKDHIGQKNEGQ